MKNRIVIGIDQSYKDTAISLSLNNRVMSVTSCKPDQKKSNTEKRKAIQQTIIKAFTVATAQAAKHHCEVVCIIERIRLQSSIAGDHFLNINYIKSIGALNALIVDIAYDFGIEVYTVDTRSWKSQIIGTSKPSGKDMSSYGIAKEKYPTIQWCINQGYEHFIKEPVSKQKKNCFVVLNKKTNQTERFIYNDNKADSICISLYGFLPEKKQKLQKEQ